MIFLIRLILFLHSLVHLMRWCVIDHPLKAGTELEGFDKNIIIN